MPNEHPEQHVCSRCGLLRDLDDFYVKNKQTGYRLSWCKTCHKRRTTDDSIRRRRGDAPPLTPSHYYRDRERTEKTCARCHEVFPIETFMLRDARTGKRRAYCPPCHNALGREYKQAHREKVNAQNAAYRAANAEILAERQRIWREEHPKEYTLIHSRWKGDNKAIVNAATHRRRNQIVENGGHWTAEEWEALCGEFDRRCLFCWRQEPEVKLTVDHVVPVSAGGGNEIANLQPLCKPCNSRKHRQTLDLRPAARQRLADERFGS